MRSTLRHAAVAAVVLALAALVAAPAAALPVPSKTAPDQSVAERDADLAKVRSVLQNDQVAQTLEAQGFTTEQAHERLAQLSPEELHYLSTQIDQLQAAGQMPYWFWVLIGVLLVIAIAAAI